MKSKLFIALSLCALSSVDSATLCHAGAISGGAQSFSIGPSVRASGTGRSSVAAFWGGDND